MFYWNLVSEKGLKEFRALVNKEVLILVLLELSL